MSKIRIVNWILTRKCNLNCSYCSLVKNYINKPKQYPDMSHYYKNEMSGERVIEALRKMKLHNSDMFHIFYGGEPFLYKDLSKIIKFCNENQVYYTIISNNTEEVQPLIKKLYNETGTIEGFSSSVDPIFDNENENSDIVLKSVAGLNRLKEMQEQNIIKDPVAEITVMKETVNHLEPLVRELSKNDIYSSITFIDTAKTNFYDFSNITDSSLLIDRSYNLAKILMKICDNDKYLVHMKNIIPEIYNILPSRLDCGIEKDLHNITVDADGSIRLCLRIRGIYTPKLVKLETLFNNENEINEFNLAAIRIDKKKYCQRCNHTCLLMSKNIDENEDNKGDLIHIDKREG